MIGTKQEKNKCGSISVCLFCGGLWSLVAKGHKVSELQAFDSKILGYPMGSRKHRKTKGQNLGNKCRYLKATQAHPSSKEQTSGIWFGVNISKSTGR